ISWPKCSAYDGAKTLSSSPHTTSVSARTRCSRRTSRVSPSGHRMRAVASIARVETMLHSAWSAPSGGAVNCVNVSGFLQKIAGCVPGRCAQMSAGGVSLSYRPNGAISTSRRTNAGDRCADQIGTVFHPGALEEIERGRDPVVMRVEQVMALPAGETRQRRRDHPTLFREPVEELGPARQTGDAGEVVKRLALALFPDAARQAVHLDEVFGNVRHGIAFVRPSRRNAA